MKRKLAIVLTTAMIAALTGCGSPTGDVNKPEQESKVEDTVASTEQEEETETVSTESEVADTEAAKEETEVAETEQESETEEEQKEEKSDEKDTETKDSETKDSETKDSDKKDSDKKDTDKKTDNKNSSNKDTDSKETNKTEKPSKKPDKTEKPSKKPDKTEKPSKKPDKTEKPDNSDKENPEEQTKETVADTLLSEFKSIAKSENAEAIANQLVTNKIISFMPAVMPVEEGMLNGFGNAEITGFKDGVMFGPMIGTIPFIGYVFELDDDTDVNQFIANLQNNADLRWNICTTADEMMTGYVDKKVFFVMCPKSFEE